jgi:hypothetical protein
VSGDHNVVSEKIKAVIPFVVWGLADEDAPGGTRSSLCGAIANRLGVAGTPKDPKMLVGRRCVIEGGVRAGSSYGFCWKTLQQICGGVEALYPILWWHGCLKQ